jgi:hypothetical protein
MEDSDQSMTEKAAIDGRIDHHPQDEAMFQSYGIPEDQTAEL